MNPDDKFLNSLEYPGGGFKKNGHGYLYQRDVLMLALWRAMKAEGEEFRMATELPEAGKLDDLVFSSRTGPEERWQMRFVQIKHKNCAQEKKITERDLFNSRSDYFVPMYFQSYVGIKGGTERPSGYSTLWKNTIQDLMVLTNIDLDDNLKKKLLPSLDEDRLLGIADSGGAAFRLPEEFEERLLSELNLMSDYTKLLSELANAVSSGQALPSSQLVRSYGLPLFDRCIARTDEPGIYKLTSRESFSNNQFYDDLMREIANRGKENCSKSQQTTDCEKIKPSYNINLPISLEEQFYIKVDDTAMSSQSVDNFIRALKSAQQDGQYLKVSVKSETAQPLARSVIVTKHSRNVFSSKFIISGNEEISANQRALRDLLKNEKGIIYTDLHKYVFDIEGKFTTWEDDLYQDLPKLHTMETVRKFRNKFKFYINYPKQEELKKILTAEIIKDRTVNFVNNYSDKMFQWITEQNISFFTKEKGKALFDEISKEELNKFLEIEKETHWSSCMNYDFKKEDKLPDTNKQISIVKCPQFKLGCLKLFRKIIKSGKEYIFTSVSRLKGGQMNHYKEAVFDLFKTTCALLVVECNQPLGRDIFEEITQILNQKKDKSVIFLVRPNSTDIEQLVRPIFKNEYHRNTSTAHIKDFTDESINKLLELNHVLFQGKSTCFKELLSKEKSLSAKQSRSEVEELDLLLPPDCIELLIFEELNLGNLIPTEKYYDRDIYIDRTLIKQLSDGNIEGTDKSYSHLKDLPNCFMNRTEKLLSEDDLLKSEERLIIVSSDAGMGKSALLTSLALKCKDEHPQDWVVRLDLNQTCELLGQVRPQVSITGTIKYIKQCLGLSEREDKIFDKILKLDKMRMYLDGVDEVSPIYFELIMGILKNLLQLENIKQITVSTRKHLKEKIEKQFKLKSSYGLKIFTADEQTSFLMKYFKKHLNLTETQDAVTERYVETIKHNLNYIIPRDVLGIPLQTMLMASLFPLSQKTETESAEDFLQREMTKLSEEFESEKFDLCSLYENFIKKKYNIWNRDKCSQVDVDIKTKTMMRGVNLEDIHTHYAIRMILSEEICTTLDIKIKEQDLYKVGLIVNLSPVEFIHRTFAEFYTAKYLCKELKTINKNVIKFFVHNVLIEDEYEYIRIFLNKMFKVKKLIENDILIKYIYNEINNHKEYVKTLAANIKHEILSDIIIKAIDLSKCDPKIISTPIYKGQSLLHIAAAKGSIQTVTKLL